MRGTGAGAAANVFTDPEGARGAILAAGAVLAIVRYFVQGYLGSTLETTTAVVGMTDALIVAPVLIGLGVVLAAASAGVAMNRYLKV